MTSNGDRRRTGRRAAGAVLGSVLLAAGYSFATHPESGGISVPPCIDIRGEARPREEGYDHIVHVDNHCGTVALCDVASSSNPVPQRVVVPSMEEMEVMVFRGASTKEFQPRAECVLVLSKK